MPEVPKPTCAQCKAPVEKMEIDRDGRTARSIFHLRCHGSYEKHEVDDEFLLGYAGRLDMVEVFQPNRRAWERRELPPHNFELPEAR